MKDITNIEQIKTIIYKIGLNCKEMQTLANLTK